MAATITKAMNSESVLLVFVQTRVNSMFLVIGLIIFAVGILLMFHHQRDWSAALNRARDSRSRLFETRKFRRRAVLASLISAAGCLMASTYWVVEPRVFAVMMAVLMLVLIGILGVAVLDLMSVGLQQIAEPNATAQKEMVKKYIELREKLKQEQESQEPPAES